MSDRMLVRCFLLAATYVGYAYGTLPTELPDWSKPRFSGKRVLITGGDSGIGFAAAEALYLECAHVLLSGHSESKSQQAAEAIAALTVPAACRDSLPNVTWMAADITKTDAVQSLVKFAIEQLGGLDIAVNNAGIGVGGGHDVGKPGFVQPDGSLFGESVLDVNLDGTLKCMNAQIRHWLDSKSPGVIVNIASVCGETAICETFYTSSKWAIEGFTRQAALQYARNGIRINSLDPGAVNTSMLRGGLSPLDPAWLAKKEAIEKLIPNHRIAEPWEMAGPITFLASDMATYVTGTSITADGGFTLPIATVDRTSQSQTATAPSLAAKDDAVKHWGEPRFRGKRILLTGGDAGIGYSAAQAFYMECAEVLVVGHNATKSMEACQQLRNLSLPQACAGSSARVECASADVSNTTQVQAVMKTALDNFGSIDIAVNNAGIYDHTKQQIGDAGFLDHDGALADKAVMDVNLLGTLKCMHFEIDHWLSRNETGSIINIASIFGKVAWGAPVYTSTKWAMLGFTKHAALLYAGQGIRINAVAPGFINTTMLRGNATRDEWVLRRKAFEEVVPLGRIAEPWEMAGPITFLASDMANYMTGATLTADGGVTLDSPFRPSGSEGGSLAEHSMAHWAQSVGDTLSVMV